MSRGTVGKDRSRLWGWFSALLIAGIVTAGHFGLWAGLHRPVVVADASVSVQGFAYAGYRADQSPLEKRYPSTEQLAEDLQLLASSAKRVRVYTSLENASIPGLARLLGMPVTAGAWLERDMAKNDQELLGLVKLVGENENIDRAIVGNEVLLRTDLTVEQMIDYLDRARRYVGVPVSTAEPWHVWLKYPQLVDHVDYIAVHLLPYHEGLPIERAVEYAMQRYDELRARFPNKHIVVGEAGWPSKGPTIGASVPSVENQARFVREFLNVARERNLDYYLMEAIDQPWKVAVEGWAGPYWGVYDAERKPKFAWTGKVVEDKRWVGKATAASLLAVLPILAFCVAFRRLRLVGRAWFSVLIQASTTVFVIGISLPDDFYFRGHEIAALGGWFAAMLLTAGVLLSNGFEFTEVLFRRGWKRGFAPMKLPEGTAEPFVSIHLPCYSEPPEMVIATLDSLARMDYKNYEVIVIDNNTKDESLWKPVEAWVEALNRPNIRFFHLPSWPGFKAGALNFALEQSDKRAEVIGVVDADYVVRPDWLSSLVGHFAVPSVSVVQAPQAHRDWENSFFRRMVNWEFDGFFRIGMHHRNERDAIIQHGTMTLVRKNALLEVGGWGEWCICEDAELGLRMMEAGFETRYVDEVLGRGLTPADFAAFKSQRFRWAFGAMQILKHHGRSLLGKSRLSTGQRYHFLTGWFPWFGDAMQFVFAVMSIAWTIGMLTLPKHFSLPVWVLTAPVLGFLICKTLLGPILYRRTMRCSWADVAGASIASLGLSHAIARGVFLGLIKKRGEFARTPKGWRAKGALEAIAPIREEMTMLLLLFSAGAAMVAVRGFADRDAMLWTLMLAAQSLPYIAALLCQVFSMIPERRGEASVAAEPLPVPLPAPAAMPAITPVEAKTAA